MAIDLAGAKTDILARIEREGFAVFFTDSGLDILTNVIEWDTRRHPDIGEFLAVARKCSTAVIVFYEQTFSQVSIDDLLERIEESDWTREEKRSYEQRLNELQKFEGFICQLEAAFIHDTVVYKYQLRTDWFWEFESIFADLTVGQGYDEDDGNGEDNSISGFFSRN